MVVTTWCCRIPKEKGIDDRISLSVGSIAVMEENAVVKYLDMMLLYFRTNIHASYSIIVKVKSLQKSIMGSSSLCFACFFKAEMTSSWEKVQSMSSGGVPSHISKILLELEYIQVKLFIFRSFLTDLLLPIWYFVKGELSSKLAGMTIDSRLGRANQDSKIFADKVDLSWLKDTTSYEVLDYLI